MEQKARGDAIKNSHLFQTTWEITVSVPPYLLIFDHLLYRNVYGMKYCIRNVHTQIHDNYTLSSLQY